MVRTKGQLIFDGYGNVTAVEILYNGGSIDDLIKSVKPELIDSLLLRNHVKNVFCALESAGGEILLPFDIHFNICADTFLNGTIDYSIVKVLNALPFRNVYLEIVEKGITREKLEKIRSIFEQLTSMFTKLKLAIDDFGGGAASQEILTPPFLFDCLKIDVEFFVGVENPDRVIDEDESILTSLIGKVKRKNPSISIILEKTIPQVIAGADGYQSFLLHHPEPFEELFCKILRNLKIGGEIVNTNR